MSRPLADTTTDPHIPLIDQGIPMKTIHFSAIALAAAVFSTQGLAQSVEVKDAWARATVQGQMASGAFMKLTAKDSGMRLVSAASPVAGVVEVHEMTMDNNVMKMRAIPGLDLPAGKAVELKPGGYHVMLMDLKLPMRKDTTIPLTLVFKDAKGAENKVQLTVPVQLAAPTGQGAGHDGHGK
jgi:periplasmic copper chaperone A